MIIWAFHLNDANGKCHLILCFIVSHQCTKWYPQKWLRKPWHMANVFYHAVQTTGWPFVSCWYWLWHPGRHCSHQERDALWNKGNYWESIYYHQMVLLSADCVPKPKSLQKLLVKSVQCHLIYFSCWCLDHALCKWHAGIDNRLTMCHYVCYVQHINLFFFQALLRAHTLFRCFLP